MNHAAFLADIVEHPDEDAPRLIYSDWLDDQGEHKRAEFIRIQCALAREPETHPERKSWLQRESELQPLLSEWAGSRVHAGDECYFRRGFLEAIQTSAARLLRDGQSIFAHNPIQALAVSDIPSFQLDEVIALPFLSHLRALRINGRFRQAGVRQLMTQGYWPRLQGLALHDTPIGAAGLRELLRCPWISQITHLDLASTDLTRASIGELARNSALKNLRALDLRGMELGITDLRCLDSSTCLQNLSRLELWFNRLGDEGITELCTFQLARRLRYLDVGYNELSDAGLRALAQAPSLEGLRTLVIGVDAFSREGLQALETSPYLAQTRIEVWLWNRELSEDRAARETSPGNRLVFPQSIDPWGERHIVGWPLWQG